MKATSSLGSRSRICFAAGLALVGVATAFAVFEAIGMASGVQTRTAQRAAPVAPATDPGQPTSAAPTDTATSTQSASPQPSLRPLLDQPIVVRLALPSGDTITSTITSRELAAMVAQVDSTTEIDTAALVRVVDPAMLRPVKAPTNARFRIVNASVTVVPSRVGLQVTPESLAQEIAAALPYTGDSRTVTLHLQPVLPTFSTMDAQAMGVNQLVSRYRQPFPAAAYRKTNIGQAARYISGTLLKPGQVFSMNDTIKERTPKNGYTTGWIIGPHGVFVMEQGGAVSAMTTALYNAVWFSGMQFVEHRAHSIYISRYPAGREATVFWGDFDMKFKNTLQHAVFITTKLHPSSVDVFIWGTREWSSIGTIFGPWTSKVAYPVIRSSDRACHAQDGMIGFHITTWRTFFRDGVEVRREPYSTSYQPSPQVICVGPTALAPSASARAKPTISVSPPVGQ